MDHPASNDIIVVAGSLYLIGEIRAILQQMAAAKSNKTNSQA
jgi:folylpolyglutamate synthase/dihydropteroate synthase